MKKLQTLLFAVTIMVAGVLTTSCAYNGRAMADSNARLELGAEDVKISETMSASATEKLILGIDWKRLFKKEVGEVRGRGGMMALPIIGSTPHTRAEGYAIYKLLKSNPDYDAVLYPQFEGNSKGFMPFFWKTDVTVKAKMVKVKTN